MAPAALVLFLLPPTLVFGGQDACPATAGTSCGTAEAAAERRHPWPYARGPVGAYGVSRQAIPRNLSAALAWTWHDPKGRFGTVLNGGLVIDDELNLYTAAVNGLHKLSPEGRLLWTRAGEFSAAPVLAGDRLHGDSKDGKMFALDLATGYPIWEKKVSESIGPDCHSVGVSEGVMVTCVNGNPMGGSRTVMALNASTGETLWNFSPSSQLWNFMPMFTGNGTLLFQDQVGGAYHLNLFDGKPIWHVGTKAGFDEFWTDGMSWLGPNGLFYAVHVHGPIGGLGPTQPSHLSAHRVSDGEFVWRKDFPYPINSQPVVAQLQANAGLSLVMCSGLQAGLPVLLHAIMGVAAGLAGGAMLAVPLCCCLCLCGLGKKKRRRLFPCLCLAPFVAAFVLACTGAINYARTNNSHFPSEVYVLDAATGQEQWRYVFPVWNSYHVRGDDEGLLPRLLASVQPICIPNGWGSPSVDASGTVWLGHQNGLLYGIRDEDGDGRIGEAEVTTFDMAASSTHFGGAYAPGMMAWTSCDTVFAFKV